MHENQLFASTVQADLSKEKVPLGQGIAGLERAAERSKGKKSPGAQSRIGWMEASVGIMIVLAVILYWRKPLVGMWQTPQQADSNLDFYQPTHSSLSGNSANGPGKTLSALQVTEALAEWNNRPKVEEIFGDCTFFVPAPEANLRGERFSP